MQSERWYPTIETLQDGTLAIVSDEQQAGFQADPFADPAHATTARRDA
jgi:hypothetical protein